MRIDEESPISENQTYEFRSLVLNLIEFSDETGLGLLEFIRLENKLGELFSVKSRFSHERFIKGKT